MRAKEESRPARLSLSDWMRIWFKGVLDPVAAFLLRLGLMPNTITLVGVAGNIIAGLVLSQGEFLWGGLLVLLMGPVDALDGAMARLRGEPSDFGAFADSVSDRYSELFIYGGLIAYFLMHGEPVPAGGVFAAAAGSVLVSYTKARAESVGFDAKVGILTRFERYLVLVPSLILGFPRVGVWVIAVLANLTALQRIDHVRRQARRS
jgi:CDP-diacylglycerol--glycerol-3-phosphate 3-phosphatidyltransferase